jgi:hypothetical protein
MNGPGLSLFRCDLAGLGQGVPLVLQATGVEHEGKGFIGHFRGGHVRAGEEHALPFAVANTRPGAAVGSFDLECLAHAVIEVADRVANLGDVV